MLFQNLRADMQAMKYRDPAFWSFLTAPFIYPSIQVLFCFRIANPFGALVFVSLRGG